MFRSDITDAGQAAGGERVRVVAPNRRALGTAHYSSTSQIALRLIAPGEEPFDREAKLATAIAYRSRIVSNSDAYRVVFSEADLLPGLIVDRYGDALVVQALTQGMDRELPEITAALNRLLAPRAIVLRNDAAVRSRESLPLEKKWIQGEDRAPAIVRMNGLAFHADLLNGQKTGVYLDQRENYAAVARYARGRMLDCFTSSGGFAMHAARAGAEHVTALDSSAPALDLARRNAQANDCGAIEFREADVFEFLASEAHGRARWDTIVLDPPAFAKSRSAVDGALRGYKEINLKALRLLSPDGVLVTCSCSHHVSEAALAQVVAEAALDAHRTLRVVERRAQAADHPILLTVPETLYLKCLILQAIG